MDEEYIFVCKKYRSSNPDWLKSFNRFKDDMKKENGLELFLLTPYSVPSTHLPYKIVDKGKFFKFYFKNCGVVIKPDKLKKFSAE